MTQLKDLVCVVEVRRWTSAARLVNELFITTLLLFNSPCRDLFTRVHAASVLTVSRLTVCIENKTCGGILNTSSKSVVRCSDTWGRNVPELLKHACSKPVKQTLQCGNESQLQTFSVVCTNFGSIVDGNFVKKSCSQVYWRHVCVNTK